VSPERVFTGPIPVLGDPRADEAGSAGGPAPIFLLADSQLLFWADAAGRFMDRVAACTGPDAPRAAYLGASNGDNPEYYSIFLAAMEAIGPAECRMIPAAPSAEELAFVESADVILLAGGDVLRGWEAFQASGVRERVERRYHEGAVLIGVSAGAVQLGTAGWPEGEPDAAFGTWGLVPLVVDAHAEEDEWAALSAVVRARGEGARGIGIPMGAGLVYHPDGSVEAIRHTLAELTLRDGDVARAVIFPPGESPS
jgi:cyanophycinase-like exopeptidase